jgi:hypothetical protein
MPHPRRVPGEAGGLAHVVQQHGPAQNALRRGGSHRVGRVAPHVVDMVPVVLVKAHAGQHLRQKHPQHLRIVQQHRQHMAAAQQLVHLRPDALRRDIRQQRRRLPQRRGGPLLDGKAQHRGEPQRPQDAQRVLLKPPFRFSHAPQDARLQVLPPAVQVDDLPPPVHGNGVHRQVPAAQVVLQPAGKRHRVRPPVVGVVPVRAERGHLDGHLPRPDGHRPVLQPRGDGIPRKQREHLLRPGGSGHVPVPRHAAQQRVPHAAAHGEGGKSRVLQPFQHIFHRLRQHGHAPSRHTSSSAAKYRQKSRLHRRKACIIIIR